MKNVPALKENLTDLVALMEKCVDITDISKKVSKDEKYVLELTADDLTLIVETLKTARQKMENLQKVGNEVLDAHLTLWNN